MSNNKNDTFVQGYISAVVTFINGHGMSTEVRDTYRACCGSMTIDKIRKAGVPEYDIEVLQKHWKELSNK